VLEAVTDDHTVIELTYNYGRSEYTVGDAFGHVAIGTNDIRGMCERVRADRAKLTIAARPSGPVRIPCRALVAPTLV